jgi:hypothetical protein
MSAIPHRERIEAWLAAIRDARRARLGPAVRTLTPERVGAAEA